MIPAVEPELPELCQEGGICYLLCNPYKRLMIKKINCEQMSRIPIFFVH